MLNSDSARQTINFFKREKYKKSLIKIMPKMIWGFCKVLKGAFLDNSFLPWNLGGEVGGSKSENVVA